VFWFLCQFGGSGFDSRRGGGDSDSDPVDKEVSKMLLQVGLVSVVGVVMLRITL